MAELGSMLTDMEAELEKRKRERALREAQLAEFKRKNLEHQAWRKGLEESTRDVVTPASLDDEIQARLEKTERVGFTPVTEELVLGKRVGETADFGDRLSKYLSSGGGFPQFPSDPSMSPQVMKNRQRLQKRRNVLRSFYGKGPKDITWSGGMTTTQLDKMWKRQVDQYLGQAFAATAPQTEDDVYSRGEALDLPLSNWNQLFDFWKDARPDFKYAKEAEEYNQLLEEQDVDKQMQKLVSLAYFNHPTDSAERDRYIRSYFAFAPHLRTKKTLDLLDANKKAFKQDAFSAEKYSVPWRYPAGKGFEKLLDGLDIEYERMGEGSDMANPYQNGRDWLKVRAGHTISVNPADTDTINTLSALEGMPGFGKVSSTYQLQAYDPNGKPTPGLLFDASNESWKDYVQNYLVPYKNFQGIARWEQGKDMALFGAQVFKDPEYVDARKDLDYAKGILSLVDTLTGLEESLEQQDVELYGSSAYFGKLAANANALLNEWTGLNLPFMTGDNESSPELSRYAQIAENALQDLNMVEGILPEAQDIHDRGREALSKQLTLLNASGGDEVTQARIMAKIIGITLATMGARLVSRNDRLLKQQYQDFRDLMDLDDIWLAGETASLRVKSMGAVARNKFNDAQIRMEGFDALKEPSTWKKDPSGFYRDTSGDLESIRKRIDDLED